MHAEDRRHGLVADWVAAPFRTPPPGRPGVPGALVVGLGDMGETVVADLRRRLSERWAGARGVTCVTAAAGGDAAIADAELVDALAAAAEPLRPRAVRPPHMSPDRPRAMASPLAAPEARSMAFETTAATPLPAWLVAAAADGAAGEAIVEIATRLAAAAARLPTIDLRTTVMLLLPGAAAGDEAWARASATLRAMDLTCARATPAAGAAVPGGCYLVGDTARSGWRLPGVAETIACAAEALALLVMGGIGAALDDAEPDLDPGAPFRAIGWAALVHAPAATRAAVEAAVAGALLDRWLAAGTGQARADHATVDWAAADLVAAARRHVAGILATGDDGPVNHAEAWLADLADRLRVHVDDLRAAHAGADKRLDRLGTAWGDAARARYGHGRAARAPSRAWWSLRFWRATWQNARARRAAAMAATTLEPRQRHAAAEAMDLAQALQARSEALDGVEALRMQAAGLRSALAHAREQIGALAGARCEAPDAGAQGDAADRQTLDPILLLEAPILTADGVADLVEHVLAAAARADPDAGPNGALARWWLEAGGGDHPIDEHVLEDLTRRIQAWCAPIAGLGVEATLDLLHVRPGALAADRTAAAGAWVPLAVEVLTAAAEPLLPWDPAACRCPPAIATAIGVADGEASTVARTLAALASDPAAPRGAGAALVVVATGDPSRIAVITVVRGLTLAAVDPLAPSRSGT